MTPSDTLDDISDNLGTILTYIKTTIIGLTYISTTIIGNRLGYLIGSGRQEYVETKISHLAGELREEAVRKVIESGYSSYDELSEKLFAIPFRDFVRTATNTIDPHSLCDLYPKIGRIAGTVAAPIALTLLLMYLYRPDIKSKLSDTYHIWKGDLQEEQEIDI